MIFIAMAGSKYRFLAFHFGKVHKRPGGLRYWILPDCKVTDSDLKMLLEFDFDKPQPKEIIEIFKGGMTKRSRVMRFQSSGSCYVAKIYRPYGRFRNLIRNHIRHRKYTFAEMKNNIRAAKLGINTPRIYAYFEETILGFVHQCGVIMEDIHDHVPLKSLLLSGKRTLEDCLPLFRKFYESGIYYMDSNTKNIMVRESDNHYTIIDWQETKFYPKINELQLCYIAAGVLRDINVCPQEANATSWLRHLRKQCNLNIDVDEMVKIVNTMLTMQIHTAEKITPATTKLKSFKIERKIKCSSNKFVKAK